MCGVFNIKAPGSSTFQGQSVPTFRFTAFCASYCTHCRKSKCTSSCSVRVVMLADSASGYFARMPRIHACRCPALECRIYMHACWAHACICTRTNNLFLNAFVSSLLLPYFQVTTAVNSVMWGGSSAGSRATDSNVQWGMRSNPLLGHSSQGKATKRPSAIS